MPVIINPRLLKIMDVHHALRTLDEITARLKNADGSMDEPCECIKLDDKDECNNEDAHEHI